MANCGIVYRVHVDSDRSYTFGVDVDELWAAIADVERYPRLWPWLKVFEARGLIAGDTWRCVVRPPLPYSVRFNIDLDEVVGPSHVTATIAGDITGTARLDLEPTADGSAIRLTSTLAPNGWVFATIATLMRPVVSRGHDWVLDTGAAQFAEGLGVGAPNDR
jgi:hypothetical protein